MLRGGIILYVQDVQERDNGDGNGDNKSQVCSKWRCVGGVERFCCLRDVLDSEVGVERAMRVRVTAA